MIHAWNNLMSFMLIRAGQRSVGSMHCHRLGNSNDSYGDCCSPVSYSLHCCQHHLRCQRRIVLQGVAQTPRLAHIVRKHDSAHHDHKGHYSAKGTQIQSVTVAHA
jgi:hypothetical protein